MKTAIIGFFTGAVFFFWELSNSGSFIKSFGISLVVTVCAELLVSIFTQKEIQLSQKDLEKRSYEISKKLRDMK